MPSYALERMKKRKFKNKFDNRDIYFYSKVRNTYSKLAKNNKRIKKFDATEQQDALFLKIKDLISDFTN